MDYKVLYAKFPPPFNLAVVLQTRTRDETLERYWVDVVAFSLENKGEIDVLEVGDYKVLETLKFTTSYLDAQFLINRILNI